MDDPERIIEPQNRVFNDALQQVFMKKVQIKAILPHLVKKNVIPEADIKRYEGDATRSMKILLGFIQNRSYETFLTFTECIFLAQKEFPANVQSTIVDILIKAVEEFDQRHSTTYAKAITDIQQKYTKQSTERMEIEVMDVAEAKAISCCSSNGDESSQLAFTLPPELEYVDKPIMVTFNSQGGQFPAKGQYPLDKYYGLSITVPPLAVPEGQVVDLQIGVCCCGPFSISKLYEVASAFYVIVADGKFLLPVGVEMDHCLILPEYRKCSEVLILKSNTKMNGFYTFFPFTHPEVSPNSPELSFEIDKFCIICSVLDETQRVRSFSLNSSMSDRSNPSSAQSSFDEEAPSFGVEGYHSKASQPSFSRALSSTSSESGFESSTESTHEQNLRKKKALSVLPKRPRAVEYAALLFKRKFIDVENQNYLFAIFICTNCGAAQKRCENHAKDILDSDVELSAATTMAITINSEVLKLEATTQKKGWAVEPEKTAEISKSEVKFHSSLSREKLLTIMDLKTYPPRLKFIAEFEDDNCRRIRPFSCKVVIKGATTTQTQNEVFFNITASIPKQTGPTGYLLNRQEAMDYSHMGQYSAQQYSPSQYGQFPPPLQFPSNPRLKVVRTDQIDYQGDSKANNFQFHGLPQSSGYYLSQESPSFNQGSPKGFLVKSEDINFLMKHLHQHAYKWREIGSSLNFLHGELENIADRSRPGVTPEQLLEDLLSQWSQWPTADHPDVSPTMDSLCDALHSGRVKLGAVANDLYELRSQLPSELACKR